MNPPKPNAQTSETQTSETQTPESRITRMRISGTAVTMTAVTSTAITLLAILTTACRSDGNATTMTPEQTTRLADLRQEGADASVTVFPAGITGSDELRNDVGTVVALMLEKAGMTELHLTENHFRPATESTLEDTAAQFGRYVTEHPVDTDYALYAQFLGTPQTGPRAIRAVIVDRRGRVVLADQQTPDDRDFKRAAPANPMACCQFLANRIRSQLQLPKSAADDGNTGRIAALVARNSPGPGSEEQASMQERLARMRDAEPAATIGIFPVRLPDGDDPTRHADQLAAMIRDQHLADAAGLQQGPTITVTPTHNEQKVLWDFARAVRDYTRQHKPDSDYVLAADYVTHAGRPWTVHFVVCDNNGEWVIVDYRNNHHAGFQQIDPRDFADCNRLVVDRVKSYLR